MSAADKKIRRFCAVCWLLFGFGSSAFSVTLPTAADIAELAQQAHLVTETFLQQSLEQRLSIKCCPESVSEADRTRLFALASAAGEQLAEIIESERRIKKQIEEYTGQEWDNLYGASGVWRRLNADIHRSSLAKCELDYHLALASAPQKKNTILQRVLTDVDALTAGRDSRAVQILKAYVFMAFVDEAGSYAESARGVLDNILDDPEKLDEIYFNAAIARARLTGKDMEQDFASIYGRFQQSVCRDNFELDFALAFLSRRYGQSDGLEKLVVKWPSCRHFLGRLLLADISHRFKNSELSPAQMESISVFEAKCLARAAYSDGPRKHAKLLQELIAVKKFRLCAMLYAAALSCIDQSPPEAIELLLEAGRVCNEQGDDVIGLDVRQISAKAAQLGCKLFSDDPKYADLSFKACQQYIALTGAEADERLLYCYSVVLRHLDRPSQAKKVLADLAARPGGQFANQAKYDILLGRVNNPPLGSKERAEVLKELSDLVCATGAEPQLHQEVTVLYCRMLLAERQESCAGKVLELVEKTDALPVQLASLLKARAMYHLDRPEEALTELALAKSCEGADLAFDLLGWLIDNIEEYQQNAGDFEKLLCNSYEVAENLCSCLQGAQAVKAQLIVAELRIFTAGADASSLAEVVAALNELSKRMDRDDVDLLRCRARLMACQGKFASAAALWARLCAIHRRRADSPAQPGTKWWRAKYYELECLAKSPDICPDDVSHTIEVLQSSFTAAPSYWGQKLSSLGEKLGRRVSK